MKSLAAGVVALVVAISTNPASATDGAVLITDAKARAGNVTPGDRPGYPATLSRAGSYILGSDLLPAPGLNGIVAASADISIDLNGFRISGGPAGGTNNGLIGIVGRGDRLTVKNGTLGAFEMAGISAPNRLYLIVENMRIINNGIGINNKTGNFTRVQNSTVATNIKDGITCGTSCEVQGSVVSGNGAHGIYCGTSCHVEGNIVSENRGVAGLYINSGMALGNTITGNTGYGLYMYYGAYGNNTLILNNNNQAGAQVLGAAYKLQPNFCNPAC